MTESMRAPAGFDPEAVAPPPLADRSFRLDAIALDVSGSCNLACRYCAEAATQPRRPPMTPETLAASWSMLFPDGRPRPGTSIRLGSGEPLLALPLLRRLDELISDHGGCAAEGRPDVFLTTNGTLTGGAVRDWLVGSGWHVKLSLDGPRQVHDRWRVTRRGAGTWRRVVAAARDLARRMPERFSVTAVLCRGADPAEVFDALAKLGTRRIELVPVAHEDKAVLPSPKDVERYRRFVDAHGRELEERPGQLPTLVRFENAIRRVMGYDLARVPCGAGRSFLGVGPTGDLYPCFRFVGLEDHLLGTIEDGVDLVAGDRFRANAGRTYERRAECRACWAAPLCGGPCFACAETFGSGAGAPVALHCEYARADAAAAVRLVARLQDRDPEALLAFLPRSVRALVEKL